MWRLTSLLVNEQLPAWCSPGMAVIFSPLISLIQDQVDSMNAIGIRYDGQMCACEAYIALTVRACTSAMVHPLNL
jgi:aerobic-type carbon monoxide dehydrogenase small subunit (CoxS/CutS family)